MRVLEKNFDDSRSRLLTNGIRAAPLKVGVGLQLNSVVTFHGDSVILTERTIRENWIEIAHNEATKAGLP